MGTNTDPYQRAEGRYHLTQGIIGVLSDARNPFSVLTKSPLVLRDLDLLAAAATRTTVDVSLSIGTLDAEVWRLTEPGAPHPRRRVTAVARLNDAGVACGVLMGPVLPGLSDGPEQLAETVDAPSPPAPGRCRPSTSTCAARCASTCWAGRPKPGRSWRRAGSASTAARANVPATLQAELSARVEQLAAEARRRHLPPPEPLRPETLPSRAGPAAPGTAATARRAALALGWGVAVDPRRRPSIRGPDQG